MALLKYNAHIIQLTHLKCAIQCLLVYLWDSATEPHARPWQPLASASHRPVHPGRSVWRVVQHAVLGSWLLSVSLSFSRFVHTVMCRYFITFRGWVMFHHKDTPHCVYSFTLWQTVGRFPLFGCYKQGRHASSCGRASLLWGVDRGVEFQSSGNSTCSHCWLQPLSFWRAKRSLVLYVL